MSAEIHTPSIETFKNIFKISITEDKPIMFDYWVDSLKKTVAIGVRESTKEKILVRSENEYTSPISNIFKIPNGTHFDYIIKTENSIYVVDSGIPVKKIV